MAARDPSAHRPVRPRPRWYTIRPRFLVALGVILLSIGGYVWWYWLPMGDGPAGPPVPDEPFRRVWRRGPVVLVAMGDSISTGFGAGGEENGYVRRLFRTPPDDPPDVRDHDLSHVFPDLTLVELAMNAADSDDTASWQLGQLDRYPPDVLGVVVVTVGGIDLIHDYGREPPRDGAIYGATYEQAVVWGAAFRQRLEGLLDGLRERFPGGVHVFLANVYDPTDGVGDIDAVQPLLRCAKGLPPWPDALRALELWNRHIAEAAAARPDFVHLVDIHGPLLGHGIHCRDRDNPYYHEDDPHHWYWFNLEDPNSRGYDAIRRLFLNRMIEVLDPARKAVTA